MRQVALLFTLMAGLTAAAQAQVQVQAGFTAGGPIGDSFHVAIGGYFHAPAAQVEACVDNRIPDEEQPVVFFIAQRAHVAPGVVIALRAQGLPWVAILGRFRLSPRIFYVPLHGPVAGTPYEHYYAFYRGGPRRMALVDADIVNMVNLRFAADYYHRPADEILRMRAGGRDFHSIHDYYHPHPEGWRKDEGWHKAEGWQKAQDRRDDRREWRRDDRDHRRDHRDDEGKDGDDHKDDDHPHHWAEDQH